MPTESMARWREVSSFECYACRETLESWNTALVPSYRLVVVPVMASEYLRQSFCFEQPPSPFLPSLAAACRTRIEFARPCFPLARTPTSF
jgi:hypothetical protein